MRQKDFSDQLTHSDSLLLHNTTSLIDDSLVNNNIGVLQGGVCSPVLFSILLDSLLVQLRWVIKNDLQALYHCLLRRMIYYTSAKHQLTCICKLRVSDHHWLSCS